MFSRSRRKIVFAIVLSLLALMAVTLGTIFLSNRIALWRENEMMLRTYAQRYSPGPSSDEFPGGDAPEGMPGQQPDQPVPPAGGNQAMNEPMFRLSTFYSVAYDKSGEVITVDSGNSDLYDEEAVLEIASSILKGTRRSGTTGNMAFLVEDKGNYTLVAMIDITVSRQNQQTLFRQMIIIGAIALSVLVLISVFIARRIVRPLEENDRRQKRFVSDAGHELKTPVAVISANSELLRRQIGESEWLDNIDYENGRMSELITQLLVLSRAENGELQKEAIDLSALVSGEVLPFESLAYEKGFSISSQVEPGLMTEGNAGQLKQLVSILLDNAISHGTGKEIGLQLSLERHHAVLAVSNDAEPMSAETLSRLFDRFYRADEARNESGAHYGLGLSIAKAVSVSHGGEIRAEYKNGKAVFTVRIPAKRQS